MALGDIKNQGSNQIVTASQDGQTVKQISHFSIEGLLRE